MYIQVCYIFLHSHIYDSSWNSLVRVCYFGRAVAGSDGWEDPLGRWCRITWRFEEAVKVSARDTLGLRMPELVHKDGVYDPVCIFFLLLGLFYDSVFLNNRSETHINWIGHGNTSVHTSLLMFDQQSGIAKHLLIRWRIFRSGIVSIEKSLQGFHGAFSHSIAVVQWSPCKQLPPLLAKYYSTFVILHFHTGRTRYLEEA